MSVLCVAGILYSWDFIFPLCFIQFSTSCYASFSSWMLQSSSLNLLLKSPGGRTCCGGRDQNHLQDSAELNHHVFHVMNQDNKGRNHTSG